MGNFTIAKLVRVRWGSCQVAEGTAFLFLLSTHTDGCPPESAAWFHRWVLEAADDFRVDHALLSGMAYGLFGLGDSAYGPDFNKVGDSLTFICL